MKRIAILGLALVALFAVMVGSASAKTEPTGPAAFTASSGESKLESEGLPEIICKASTATGELTNGTQGHTKVTFTECASEGKKCGNTAPGTIETKELETTVGWINKAKGEAGVDFIGKTGEGTKGSEAEFSCEGLAVSVKGSVIGRESPTNTMSTESKIILNGTAGKQEVQNFEGKPKDTLLTEVNVLPGSEIPSAQVQTATVKIAPFKYKKGTKEAEIPDNVELNTVVNPTTPEQGRCHKAKGGGKFADANCSTLPPEKKGKPGKGKYEFTAL